MDDFNINKYDDRFVTCRTFGHAWSMTSRQGDDNTVWIYLTCANCTASREDEVSRLTGSLFSRSYTYPEGYCHTGKLTRDEYRRRFLSKKSRKRS